MSRQRTDLDTELEFGGDLKNRRIHFGKLDSGEEITDVDNKSIDLAVRLIHRMEAENPKLPIEIYMNSFGGSIYAVLYLVDVIQSSPCQFKFYGGGAVMSAASFVMSVCDERYLYKNARVMVHNGSDDNGCDRHDDFNIATDEGKRLRQILTQLYTDNSFMPYKFWDRALKRDLYLSAEEAIQLGLADFIVEYKKRGNLRKRRVNHLKKPNKSVLKDLVTTLFKRIDFDVNKITLEINEPKVEEVDPTITVEPMPVTPIPEDVTGKKTE